MVVVENEEEEERDGSVVWTGDLLPRRGSGVGMSTVVVEAGAVVVVVVVEGGDSGTSTGEMGGR